MSPERGWGVVAAAAGDLSREGRRGKGGGGVLARTSMRGREAVGKWRKGIMMDAGVAP